MSLLGDAVTAVALPLTAVTVLHASGFEVGLVTAAGYAAWAVIGLPAGTLVGRLPLRGTQVAMDLVRAAALLSVPVTGWLGLLGVPQLVLVALAVSTAGVVFDIGNSTLLPSIVGRDELTARNSWTSASVSATQLCGPALGGALVQLVGAATSLIFDVASYLVSAVMLRTLPRPRRLTPARPDPSARGSIREGWRFVTGHQVIRPCVLDATVINFVCGGLMTLTPVFLVQTLHASPGLVGVLIAAEGAGSLAGATLTPRLSNRVGSARAVLLAATAAPALIVLMPVASTGWGLLLFAAGNAGFAAAVVVSSILTRTHRQTITPPDLLPRVMATVRFISWGAVPAGALGCGAAASLLGPRTALWLDCAVILLAPAILWASPIRTQRELADADGLARPSEAGAPAHASTAGEKVPPPRGATAPMKLTTNSALGRSRCSSEGLSQCQSLVGPCQAPGSGNVTRGRPQSLGGDHAASPSRSSKTPRTRSVKIPAWSRSRLAAFRSPTI